MLSREPANFRVDASVKGRRGRLNDCLVSRDGERRGMREYDVIPLLFSFLSFFFLETMELRVFTGKGIARRDGKEQFVRSIFNGSRGSKLNRKDRMVD